MKEPIVVDKCEGVRPRVVNCHVEACEVYVGRGFGSIWGNPFVAGYNGIVNRNQAVSEYTKWIVTQPQLMARLSELRGKCLGCWCAPKKPCHADILMHLANSDERTIDDLG